MAVVGVLIALLLPAAQQARATARRAICRSSFRQIGVALHNYHEVYGQFPINSGNHLSDQRPFQVGNHRKGTALTLLLPFLDERAFYGRLNFHVDVVAQIIGDDEMRTHVVPVFLCPSDANGDGVPNQRAMTNYVPSLGAQEMVSRHGDCDAWSTVCNAFGNGSAPWGETMDPSEISGVFARHSWAASFRDIRDGTASTIAMGEVRAECNERIHNRGWYDPMTMFFATTIPINFDSCTQDRPSVAGCRSWIALDAAYGFKSSHPGGCHVLFCDGSVRFLNESIDYLLYQKLGDRHDGYAVTGF